MEATIMIELLLPIGYVKGTKVTDMIINTLHRIYPEITHTIEPQGGCKKLIILNSFIPHSMDYILTKYHPKDIWYYMYDMTWGSSFYFANKPNLQLMTDKDYVDTRVIIPNPMIELSECPHPTHYSDIGNICIMESYKYERFSDYAKYLLQDDLKFDVIGTTMNKMYNHNHNKVASVVYEDFENLLSMYSFCFILHDEYHSAEYLPSKPAECLRNGVLPILDSKYKHPFLPSASSIEEIKVIMDNFKDLKLRKEAIDSYIWRFRDSVDIDRVRRNAQLGEIDWIFTDAMEQVLVWGREKHKGHYWRDNLDVKDFMAALQRHIDAYNRGEKLDPETGESHLIHAACNLQFQFRIDK